MLLPSRVCLASWRVCHATNSKDPITPTEPTTSVTCDNTVLRPSALGVHGGTSAQGTADGAFAQVDKPEVLNDQTRCRLRGATGERVPMAWRRQRSTATGAEAPS